VVQYPSKIVVRGAIYRAHRGAMEFPDTGKNEGSGNPPKRGTVRRDGVSMLRPMTL
jgi:hypothetical protein